MFERIDHIAITVKDLEKSINFYERHFGFKKYFEHDVPVPYIKKIAYLKLGEGVLELVHAPDSKSSMEGFHFCFKVKDFDEAVSKLKGEGIPVITEPHPTPPRSHEEEGWKRVVFKGPDGESIELRGK